MDIHFKSFFQATKPVLDDLDALQAACLAVDGDVIPVYKNVLKDKRTEPFWMAYSKEGRAIGFVSAFYFFDQGAEVALMVHPDDRRQGLAKKLLTFLYPRLAAHDVSFVSFSSIEAHPSWPAQFGGVLDHLECQLEYHPMSLVPLDDHILLRRADLNDEAAIQGLESSCFGEEMKPEHIRRILSSPCYEVWLLVLQGQVVGKVHLRHDPEALFLSNLAVHPAVQRRSYGSLLLKHAMNVSFGLNKKLILDVEAQNQGAWSLYLKHGFEMTSKIGHWHFSLEKIKAFCLL